MTLVGRNIGRYRILEQLGQGGMSVVYKGLDTALDREVAVKVLHPHLSGKEESRKRLAREAKAVAKLHHPNILEVFDYAGAEAEDAYIVTEYIRGQTLRTFATTEAFDPPELAAMVIHQLSAALAHAHEAGVIHRDLKPENVMVRQDGVLKLMDFGIAKMIDRDEKMTMTGALVGSPAHMAPEIIEGEEAGAEADIFSLGTMLYSFATGKLPFSAPNPTATLKKILDGAYEDPRQLSAKLSDELAVIIATCLARQPSDRYSNAGQLRDALAALLAGVGLTHIDEELMSFFADPPSYRRILVPKLIEALLARGEKLITEQRSAKALSGLNQVLALDPTNERALALLRQMNAALHRRRALANTVKGLLLTGGLLVALAAAHRGYRATHQIADYGVPSVNATDVSVPARAYPPLPVAASPEPAPVGVLPEPRAAPPPPVRVVRAEVRPGPALPVRVRVRPYGFVRVDDGAISAEQTNTHALGVPAGKHRFAITCKDPEGMDVCEELVREVVIAPGAHNELEFVVKLKPSRLSFNYEPPEASVHIAAHFEGVTGVT